MRKITVFAALLAVAAAAVVTPGLLRANAEAAKPTDVWIVAGQSNAAGYSLTTQTVHGQADAKYKYADKLTADDGRNATGYPQALYYGATDVAASAALPTIALQQVQSGLGRNPNYIGPELGMAHALSARYTADAPAAIVKYAVGGTYLGDFGGAGRETQDAGNWASPTMTAKAQAAGTKLHANNGLLYTRLLTVTENGLAALRAKGYAPQVKGYIFMQGEADAGNGGFAAAYAANLETFIGDLRADVARLSGDADAAKRPFIIGKICPSGKFGGHIEVVRAAQDAVAKKLENVYTVETEDLAIYTANGTPNGTDDYHFNAWDMYTLGQRFATTATQHLAKYTFTVTAGAGGSVGKSVYLSDGEAVRIDYTTTRGKRLDKVLLGGEDVTQSAVIDGAITVTPTGDAAFQEIALTFTDATAYTLTVDVGLGGKIRRSISGSTVYEGETVLVEPLPSDGYETEAVRVNGQEIAGEGGQYAVHITGDTTLKVTFRATQAAAEPTEKGGCGSAVAATSVVGAVGVLTPLIACIARRKRRA